MPAAECGTVTTSPPARSLWLRVKLLQVESRSDTCSEMNQRRQQEVEVDVNVEAEAAAETVTVAGAGD